MMEMLTNLVTQSGVGATQLSAILLGVLFLTMIIGLATGQELAFVLGGAGVIIGYLAWGGPGITIAMTKVYDQMQRYRRRIRCYHGYAVRTGAAEVRL